MNIDLLSGGGMIAIIGALVFIAAGIFAYILFRILRKSIRIAFRLALVAAIMVIALVGGLSLWWFNSGDAPAERPRPTRRR